MRSASSLPSCRAAAPSSSVPRAEWTSAWPRPTSDLARSSGVVVPAGRGDRPAQPGDAGLGGAGVHGGQAGLDEDVHRRRPGDARPDRGERLRGRRGEGRARLDPELQPKQLGAGRHLALRGVGVAGGPQAADEEDVRVLVVRIQPHEVGGVVPGPGGVAAGKEGEGRLVQHGGRCPGDVAALVLEPVLEGRARAEGHAVEELVAQARQRGRFQPRALAEDLDVDEGALAERQPDGIAADLGVRAELAAERCEGRAERPERVVGLGEEQARRAARATREPRCARGR